LYIIVFYDRMIHVTDWLPTLYSAAGGNADLDLSFLDGHNQWQAIVEASESKRSEMVYNINPGIAGHCEYAIRYE